MVRLWILLRHDWPLHFVLLLTNWLPDNVIFLRFRGWLARPFLGKCGHTLNLGRNITFHNPSSIQLGNYVHISYGCMLMATSDILIEDEVMFGPYCVLISGNHSRLNSSYRFGPPVVAPIKIARGSWLGANVVVTSGSVIETGTIVAAGAVVTGEFPPDVLVGGIPARKIKDLH